MTTEAEAHHLSPIPIQPVLPCPQPHTPHTPVLLSHASHQEVPSTGELEAVDKTDLRERGM